MERKNSVSALGAKVMFVMATAHEYGSHLRRRIDPIITGVGPIEAAIGTTAALIEAIGRSAKPALVVSLGSAGSRRLEVGTVWRVSSVSWRDMDARRLGFPKGVTPFADHNAEIALPTLLDDLPTATLSTGSDVVGGQDYHALDADLVDMETFAVVRVCERFDVPVLGLRAVSDGPGELADLGGWTQLLLVLDARLADALDHLLAAMSKLNGRQQTTPAAC